MKDQLSLSALQLLPTGQDRSPTSGQPLFAGMSLGPAAAWCSLSNSLLSRCLRVDTCTPGLCLYTEHLNIFLNALIEKNYQDKYQTAPQKQHGGQRVRDIAIPRFCTHISRHSFTCLHQYWTIFRRLFCFVFLSANLGKISLKLMGVQLSRE